MRVAIAALAFGACRADAPPIGEAVLYVDTDAPVAKPGDPGLVDRVRFEILRGGVVVPNGTRDFLVDEERFREKAVSIGILPVEGLDSITVRVRLFRDDRARTAEPSAGVTLDTIVRIPPVGQTGISRYTVRLSADDFGRRVGEDHPIEPEGGEPVSSKVSTSRHARHAGCIGPLGDEEACIPGGAFFFGDPALRGRTEGNDITDERVVVLSPFFLDRVEVTVADFRRAWAALSTRVVPPTPWSGRSDGASQADYCTWRQDPKVGPSSLEGMPVNCIPWDTARAYCRELGKELPTEAQFEYVMSGMGREQAYVWGDDEPDCAAAVWGRAGVGYYSQAPADCRDDRGIGGVSAAGSGVRDNVTVDGRAVLDLGGNVAEWARDLWSRENEPFWRPVVAMFDPVADYSASVDGDRRPVRGGRWAGPPLSCRAGHRLQNPPTDAPPSVGFRCVRAVRSTEVSP
jgi:formylglycine-generating enzyme required for sulfatase activity